MSIPFSRSMRSLQADSSRPTLFGMGLAAILMAAWLAWFFLGNITIYESSQSAKVTPDGYIIAQFSPESLAKIKQGQYALLRINGTPSEDAYTRLAVVTDTYPAIPEKEGQVKLFILLDEVTPVPPPAGTTGQVDIEVEYISPALLVMRASGQFLDTPLVSVSPQKGAGQ
ncbi:MAG: hypothetical protein JW981_04045 [Anaerolineae bacterium]|nr:hypothetical protein [Anaerolineae bacterium]